MQLKLLNVPQTQSSRPGLLIFGYLEKLGFFFKVEAGGKIDPEAYSYYAEDSIFPHNEKFGQKDNF